VHEFYAGSDKNLRLETERGNLEFVLANSELTVAEKSQIIDRLIIVENELLQLLTSNLPN